MAEENKNTKQPLGGIAGHEDLEAFGAWPFFPWRNCTHLAPKSSPKAVAGPHSNQLVWCSQDTTWTFLSKERAPDLLPLWMRSTVLASHSGNTQVCFRVIGVICGWCFHYVLLFLGCSSLCAGPRLGCCGGWRDGLRISGPGDGDIASCPRVFLFGYWFPFLFPKKANQILIHHVTRCIAALNL